MGVILRYALRCILRYAPAGGHRLVYGWGMYLGTYLGTHPGIYLPSILRYAFGLQPAVYPSLYSRVGRTRGRTTVRVYTQVNLWSLATEQLDEWFGKQLLSMLPTISSFDDGDVRLLIWTWAWEILGTNAGSEFVHGRNRRRCHANMHWQNFVAKCYNMEAKQRLLWQQKASSMTSPGRYC